MTGSYAPPKGLLFVDPQTKPLINGAVQPSAQRFFYVTGTLVPAVVYQDGYLQTPFVQPIVADAFGRFAPIYLDSSVLYRTRLFSAGGALLEDADPVVEQPITLTSSVLSAAIQTSSPFFSATGLAVTVTAPGFYSFEAYLEVGDIAGASAMSLQAVFSGTITAGTLTEYTTIGNVNANVPFYENFGALGGGTFAIQTNPIRSGMWVRGGFVASSAGVLSLNWSTGGSGTIQLAAGSFLLAQQLVIPGVPGVGVIFKEPQAKPLSVAGQAQPGSYWLFTYSGGNAPAFVYADAGLQRPLSQIIGQQSPSCTADLSGRFSPIYTDPAVTYRAVLYSQSGTPLESVDPYVPRAFEIVSAVKLVPTTRPTGAGEAADPALQVTLNPGVYAIESLLEFTSNGSGLTVPFNIGVISGGGALSPFSALSVAYESNGTGQAAGAVTLPNNLALNLVTGPNTLTAILLRGSITVGNGSVVLGVNWSPVGAAGNLVALTSGSYLTATPVG